MEGYCIKCKKMSEMKNPVKKKLKNGRDATTGTCKKCGTKIFKIGKY